MKDTNKIMDDMLEAIEVHTYRVTNSYDSCEDAAKVVKNMSEAYLNLMQAKSLKFSMTDFIELKKEGGTTCKGPYT